MLSETEMQAIRTQVALEPEGSLARTLLTELDERKAAETVRAHNALKADLKRTAALTDEEANRLIAALQRGQEIQTAMMPCRHCQGTGTLFTSGCIGGTHRQCSKCFGGGKAKQIVVPPTLREEYDAKLKELLANRRGARMIDPELETKLAGELLAIFTRLTPEEQAAVKRPEPPQGQFSLIAHDSDGRLIGYEDCD